MLTQVWTSGVQMHSALCANPIVWLQGLIKTYNFKNKTGKNSLKRLHRHNKVFGNTNRTEWYKKFFERRYKKSKIQIIQDILHLRYGSVKHKRLNCRKNKMYVIELNIKKLRYETFKI